MKKDNNIDIISGRNAVEELLESGKSIEKIFLHRGIRGPFEKYLRHSSREKGFPLSYVEKEKLDRISRSNHQGVIAFTTSITYYSLDQLLPQIFEEGKTPLIVMLDGVTDVRNMGAISRSAEIFGANGLVVPIDGTAMINDFAMKASAGALLRLPVCRERSLVKAVEFMQNSGLEVHGLDGNAEKEISDLPFDHPVAIVMGSEGKGLRPSVHKACDGHWRIPQMGQLESLNVSVAAGIVLYESMKRRLKS
jgi:23S rRNA (guanosine2251-2'-O)-methyltransferase